MNLKGGEFSTGEMGNNLHPALTLQREVSWLIYFGHDGRTVLKGRAVRTVFGSGRVFQGTVPRQGSPRRWPRPT